MDLTPRLARRFDRVGEPTEPDGEPAESLLSHVPFMDLRFDGDCVQANGVELPIAVINLPHRTDRWQTLTRRMAAMGLDKLIHVPAVVGAGLSAGQISALLRSPGDVVDGAPRSHLSLTRPAIGCFLSHLAVWRCLVGTNLPRLLVLEDDAMPTAHFSAARLRGVLASLPIEAGLVFPGRIIMGGLADRAEGSGFARLYYFNGTFAYLITPAACRALLRHLLPLRAHIDHQISGVLIEQRHAFSSYYTEPALFEPDWSLRSDCYVPLTDEAGADRELGRIIEATRRVLISEGRPLLPA
jgi:glycosyl transferase, family 25